MVMVMMMRRRRKGKRKRKRKRRSFGHLRADDRLMVDILNINKMRPEDEKMKMTTLYLQETKAPEGPGGTEPGTARRF